MTQSLPRRNKKAQYQLTQAIRLCLEAGADLTGEFSDLSERELESKLDSLWKIHGAEVTADFVRRFPTERPALWWKHDSPAKRPPLEHEYCGGDDFELFMAARQKRRIAEVAILVRHKLLTAEEQRGFKVPGA